MKVADLIRFRSDVFFDGAVQLLWADDDFKRANDAARSFVFHGPRYHGVSKEGQADEIYRLTDTATLAADLLSRIADETTAYSNPFSLAIAGYGSGKSHFALALTRLLRDPSSELSEKIVANLTVADSKAAEKAKKALKEIEKPALVIALDGTGNFNLGNALSASLYRSLKEQQIDDRAIRELSPRFEDAANFVERNFERRTSEFSSRFPGKSKQSLVEALASRDEDTYTLVDALYFDANGAHIPVAGRESIQDLITVFCETYCSKGGPFSRLVIMFDEFGRFLEYVAERPALAGDSALQQIFQGIQDNASHAHFVGFIQYELKAYLARLGSRDAMHIQKYITRFDISKKYYVSSNLETIIAHLLEKKDEFALESALEKDRSSSHALHAMMAEMLPGFDRLPVWNNPMEFERVIVRGCWPLHPLATWFLTRQQDIVQSRSAITFVKNAVDAAATKNVFEGQRLTIISASHLLAGDLLMEMLAAERAHGGATVDNLVATLTKYEAQLDELDRGLLTSIAAAKKMRVVSSEQQAYDRFLAELVGRPHEDCHDHLSRLDQELGVIAWSKELKQYEIVTDAATRGQYQKDLRNKVAAVSPSDVMEIFINRAKVWSDKLFDDVATTFGQERDIPTLEWSFTSQLTNDERLTVAMQNAFSDWRLAVKPDQAKGQILYCFTSPECDLDAVQKQVKATQAAEMKKADVTAAPIWTVLLSDRSHRVQRYLATLYALDESFDQKEQERYSRFIPEERENAKLGLRSALRDVIKDRVSIVAGIDVASGRLSEEASSVFKQVYPHAFPFPFDGLNTKNGNGSADIAAISRALFGDEVSAAWLAVQQVRLQNRVRAVLGESWGSLTLDGKVKPTAGNPQIRSVLEKLEKAHKSMPTRSLGEDLTLLTRPPFGCNLASASLLIALFVGKPIPPRAIQYQKQGVSLKEWLEAAYGTNGKFLLEAPLEKTTILFLTEDSITRWKVFLNRWEAETTLQLSVSCLKEAEKMRSRDPLPEQLEPNFKYLRDRAHQENIELEMHVSFLQEVGNRLELAIKSGKVQEFLAAAQKYVSRRKDMSNHPTKWTAEQHDELTDLCAQIAELLRETVPKWLRSQACNTAEQISDFRSKMERTQKTLESLDLKEMAREVERHTQGMIARVKERYQYENLLTDTNNFLRTLDPLPSTPLQDVIDRISKAESLTKLLKEAVLTLTRHEDVDELIVDLQAKHESLRQFCKGRKSEYSALLELSPGSTQEAKDILYRLTLMGQQLLGTRDADDVQMRIASCSALVNSFCEFDEISGAPEQITSILKAAFELTCVRAINADEIDATKNEDDEQEREQERLWLKGCVEKYISSREASLLQSSSVWTAAAVEELGALKSRTQQLMADGIPNKFLFLPAMLSDIDRARLTSEIEALDALRLQALEDVRARRSAEWTALLRSKISKLENLSTLECADFLEALNSRPPYVSSADFEQMLDAQKHVQRRLDEFDVSDLLARIHAMPAKKRSLLLKQLRILYQEAA